MCDGYYNLDFRCVETELICIIIDTGKFIKICRKVFISLEVTVKNMWMDFFWKSDIFYKLQEAIQKGILRIG